MACHGKCVQFQDILCPELMTKEPRASKLMAKNICDFDPPLRDSLADLDAIRWKIRGTKLPPPFHNVPPEIQCLVWEHFLSDDTLQLWCIISALTTGAQQQTVAPVSLSRKIWARYVSILGTSHVAALTNNPGEAVKNEVLIYDPASAKRAVDTIYVAHDLLGLKRVVFADSSGINVLEAPGIWWKTLRI
ncbi:hypothetical protein EsDP_00002594 [Epichloe bromicola]|uniref:Uncharacterized protein n=1 Tax=Epichloe bromicola TaxID=79588 RepID=A0ABQ0CLA4_9HYPO